MALWEINFENRLYFVEESTKIELHTQLSYIPPNSPPRRAMLAFFSQ